MEGLNQGFNRYFHFRLRRTRGSRSRTNMALAHPPTVWASPSYLGRQRAFVEQESEYDAFCNCWKESCNGVECTCGETGKALEWVWDVGTKSNCTHLVNNNKDVRFHLHFSGGTAVIKGNCAISANQHYWEVKMTSLVYGTDMMVGIGTKEADVHKLSDKFCSVLGIDSETWGLSYTGLFHHQGVTVPFSSGFGQGTIIGVHLDMWNGTLSFYKNRQPLGIACRGLKGKTLYPMVSSTAARSGMRIIHSVSFPSSLQFLCCVALRKAVPADQSVFDVVPMPPGMQIFLANNLAWLLGDCHLENVASSYELSKNNASSSSVLSTQLASSPACLHQYLTCDDCNTPVFAGSNKDVENSLLKMMPSHVLQVGPILLQRCSLRMQSEDSGNVDSDKEDKESGGAETKKRRYSYNYSVGVSEDDDTD